MDIDAALDRAGPADVSSCEKVPACNDLTGLAAEHQQQVELGRCQRNKRAQRIEKQPAGRFDAPSRESQGLRSLQQLTCQGLSTKQAAYPGENLQATELFKDTVIRTRFERMKSSRPLVLGYEKDQQQAEASADLPAERKHLGKIREIQDYKIEGMLPQGTPHAAHGVDDVNSHSTATHGVDEPVWDDLDASDEQNVPVYARQLLHHWIFAREQVDLLRLQPDHARKGPKGCTAPR